MSEACHGVVVVIEFVRNSRRRQSKPGEFDPVEFETPPRQIDPPSAKPAAGDRRPKPLSVSGGRSSHRAQGLVTKRPEPRPKRFPKITSPVEKK
jgi:hypothetical protein